MNFPFAGSSLGLAGTIPLKSRCSRSGFRPIRRCVLWSTSPLRWRGRRVRLALKAGLRRPSPAPSFGKGSSSMRSIRSSVSTLIGFAGLCGMSCSRTSSGWRSSKGSNGKETRPSGDRQARVRWAPSDGPASDRRPLAQMAPAPSEPRATTFSSRDPAVHRPFGLFAAAADLLVPAQVARQRAPDPRAARSDRGSRESAEASAVTLRSCFHCGRHYHSGTGVRGRCGDCGRAYDRELSRQKRARRTRNSAAWQKARAAAKQRDGNRRVNCGAIEGLQVHHVVRLEDAGALQRPEGCSSFATRLKPSASPLDRDVERARRRGAETCARATSLQTSVRLSKSLASADGADVLRSLRSRGASTKRLRGSRDDFCLRLATSCRGSAP
jgi:hypothetical protein